MEIKHSFPNPREEPWLKKRLEEFFMAGKFCDCDEANWVDGTCWNCIKPCDPEHLRKDFLEELRIERNKLNRKISKLKKVSPGTN